MVLAMAVVPGLGPLPRPLSAKSFACPAGRADGISQFNSQNFLLYMWKSKISDQALSRPYKRFLNLVDLARLKADSGAGQGLVKT